MLQKFAQSRFNAFLIHLAISALIACTVIFFAILVWYPGYFLDITGAKKIFLMIIGIDVCLGPILTLIVFNKAKKGLSRDLNIIFLIQICALVYGMYTITIARPVYIVFAVDRFELVQANDITKENLKDASQAQFKSLPLFSPKWISTLRPTDKQEKENLLFSVIDAGIDGAIDLAQLPKYYTDYSNTINELKKRTIPLSALQKLNPDKTDDIDDLFQRFPPSSHYGYIPLAGKKESLTVIINMETGQPVDVVNLKPWL